MARVALRQLHLKPLITTACLAPANVVRPGISRECIDVLLDDLAPERVHVPEAPPRQPESRVPARIGQAPILQVGEEGLVVPIARHVFSCLSVILSPVV